MSNSLRRHIVQLGRQQAAASNRIVGSPCRWYSHAAATEQEQQPASSSTNQATPTTPSPPPTTASPQQQQQQQPSPPPPPPPSPPTPAKKPLSQSRVAAQLDKLPLPWLSRPLGVPTKPIPLSISSTLPKKTRAERTQDYLSGGRQKERENIIKAATKGYFHDFHSMRAHGGKTWRAPATMIREEKALWFPQITGTCIADRSTKDTAEMLTGKVSIVALLSFRISEEHTKSFYSPTFDVYSSHPNFQLIQLNLQPNLMKHYLISLFLSSLRSSIREDLHKTYLLSKLNLDDLSAGEGTVHREDLGVANKHVGYTYLVDQNGKIRWAGAGFAEPAEKDALLACTGVLLERISAGGT